MITNFPNDLEKVVNNGFGYIKLSELAKTDLIRLLVSLEYNRVKDSEVECESLYTVGTEMLANYNTVANTIIETLKDEVIDLSEKLLGVETGSLEATYFISKGTEGYNVPWHSDHQSDDSVFSVPIYLCEGKYSYESGMLEFALTEEVMSGNDRVIASMPARSGYGAVIWSGDSKFSHRATEVTVGTRYMIRFEIVKKSKKPA